jgi:hypothetical protein
MGQLYVMNDGITNVAADSKAPDLERASILRKS